MKKWFFAVSLIFIAAGLAIAASGYYPIAKEDQYRLAYIHNVPLQNSSDGIHYIIENTTAGIFVPNEAAAGSVTPNPAQWTVSANLTEGDMITIPITQGVDWPEGYFDIDETLPSGVGALYITVKITDPRGNFTLFDMTLGKAPQGSASSSFYFLTTFYINISDPSWNQGGLDTSPFYSNASSRYLRVGGIAQFNGTYTVTVGPPYPARNCPITSLEIRKHVSRKVYTIGYTLPVGLTVSGAGAALTWVSVRKNTRTPHNRRVYTELKRQR